jgi:uncharacterized protein YgbK (DUF1537 family)
MDVVRGLPPTLGFLISKGGITSNDVLSDGLALKPRPYSARFCPAARWCAARRIIRATPICPW